MNVVGLPDFAEWWWWTVLEKSREWGKRSVWYVCEGGCWILSKRECWWQCNRTVVGRIFQWEFNRNIRKLGDNFQSERLCKFVFLQADRRTDIKNSNLNRSIEWNYSFILLGDSNVRITSVLLRVVYRLKRVWIRVSIRNHICSLWNYIRRGYVQFASSRFLLRFPYQNHASFEPFVIYARDVCFFFQC